MGKEENQMSKKTIFVGECKMGFDEKLIVEGDGEEIVVEQYLDGEIKSCIILEPKDTQRLIKNLTSYLVKLEMKKGKN